MRVELTSFYLNLALSCRVSPGIVSKINASRLKALNIAGQRADMNLRVRLHHLDLVLKIDWAVTLDLKLLGVGLADEAAATHVYELGEELVHAGVNDREGVDGDQDLVALTVDPHRVIVVLILVDGGRELNVDVLGDARRDHPLLLVPDFEETSLRRQDVQPLGRRRVVDQAQLHRVRLVRLETRKFDHCGGRAEDAIGADGVIDEFLGNAHALVGLGLGDDAPRNFNLVLTVWRLTHYALFKLAGTVVRALRRRLVNLGRPVVVHAPLSVKVAHAGARDACHRRVVLILVRLRVYEHLSRHFLCQQLSKM